MTNSNTQNTPTQKPVNRMRLDAVRKGKIDQPIRALLAGPEGIGKSTFGAHAPRPIFLCAEDGTSELDIVRFPEPQSWADVLDAVRTLTTDEHDYQTLVLDTLDWLEPMLWRGICARDRKGSIEDYGYGKGYVAALEEWRVLISVLEGLRRARRMHVVMLAHTTIRTFKNPEGDDYDRYTLKLHEKAGGLLKEWVDAVLFANYETFVATEKGAIKGKGFQGGARFIHTERRAAWDAKNRYGLPERLPLDWYEFESAIRGGDPSKIRAQIAEQAARIADDKKRDAILAWVPSVGDDLAKLREGLNRVVALAGPVAEQQ